MAGVHVQHLTLYHIFDTTEYIHQVILMCISRRGLYPSSTYAPLTVSLRSYHPCLGRACTTGSTCTKLQACVIVWARQYVLRGKKEEERIVVPPISIYLYKRCSLSAIISEFFKHVTMSRHLHDLVIGPLLDAPNFSLLSAQTIAA
jgi:hypothetical protein